MRSKILIVEDEMIEAMNFERLLVSFGYDVVGIASTGKDAIKMADELRPDLILMDIVLKGKMDGIEATAKIKEEFDIPVVYLTAHPGENAVNRAKLTTPYGYLIKPVSKTDLKNTIEIALYKSEIEYKLRKSEDKYRKLVDNSMVGVYKTNLQGDILFTNDAMAKIFGYDNVEELKENNIINLYKNPDDRLQFIHKLEKEGKFTDYEVETLDKNGKTINVVVSASLENEEISGMFMNITDRRKAEAALQEREEFLSGTLNDMTTFVAILKLDGEIIFVNNTPLKLIEKNLEDVKGMMFYDIAWWTFSKETMHKLKQNIKLCASGETIDYETQIQTPHGLTWIDYNMHPIYDEKKKVKYLVAEGRDITIRKNAEERIDRLYKLYATLSQVNQNIVRVKDRHELFERICKVCVEFGKFRMAWIGLIDEKTGIIQPAAHYGYEDGYLKKVIIDTKKEPSINQPIIKAVHTGEVVLNEDIKSELKQEWRDESLKRGYRSLASIPIDLNGKIIGILNIYASEPNFFTKEEIFLAKEIGADISYALNAIKLEKERDRLILEIQRSKDELQILIDNIVDEVWFCDKNGNILLANAPARKFEEKIKETSKKIDSLIDVVEVLDEDGNPRPHEGSPILRSLNGEILTDLEEIVIFPDKTKQYRQVSSTPIYNEKKIISGAVAVVRDITNQKNAEKMLIQAKEDWEETFNALPDLIAIIDTDYKIIRCNKSMASRLGINTDKCSGLTCYDVVHGLDAPPNFCPHSKLIEDHQEHDVEVHEDLLGGDFLVSVSPLHDKNGELMGCVHVARDITQRKKSEKEILSQYYVLKGIMDSTDTPKFSVDTNYIYTSFNQSHANVMKALYDADIEIGKSILDYQTVQEDRFTAKKNLDHALKGERIIEEAYSGEEGLSRLFFEVSHNPIKDANGKIIGVAVLAEDITERKIAEYALRESEEKYRTLFESDPDYTILLNLEGILLDVNRAAEEIIGLSKDELVGKHFSQLGIFPEEELDLHRTNFSNLLKNGYVGPQEARIIDQNGNIRWVENKFTIVTKEDEIDYILIIGSDITERKIAANKIKSTLKEKETLLKEIHHRVKNNLQIISSLLDLQENYVKEDPIAVNILKESQNRVLSMALIHEMLYQSEDLNQINISYYIRSLVSNLIESYGNQSIKINLVLEDNKLNIETAIPLGLLISELFTNSLKYAFPRKKGTIKIELQPKNKKYELMISDNGIGLPKNIDLNTESTLGLRLVKSLINQLDGSIGLDRTNGTRYTITFKELKYNKRF